MLGCTGLGALGQRMLYNPFELDYIKRCMLPAPLHTLSPACTLPHSPDTQNGSECR